MQNGPPSLTLPSVRTQSKIDFLYFLVRACDRSKPFVTK